MNVEILARLQFAFTTFFHYIFPPISIGLGLMLVVMEGAWLRTGNEMYKRMAHFWVKVFALVFGIGVASGIVLEFEFGTNWATYSRYVGDIFGSALAAEGVFAFFLESGFLAILVFGWHKVTPKWHFFSTCMVALGSTFSAVWIVVANSWMQTPAGFKIVGEGTTARAEITDFWAMVFNPSTVDRLSHTVVGAWITGAMLVVSVSAYYVLKNRHLDIAKAGLKMGLVFALVSCGLQIWLGHQSAIGVAKNQPSKFAAMEGHYDSDKPIDLTVLGAVDEQNGRVSGLTLPGLGSTLMGGPDVRATGLTDIPARDRPPVQLTFQMYHLMVFLGVALTLLVVVANVLLATGKLWTNRAVLGMLVGAVVVPHVCNQAGWIGAEVGRQPWIVFNLLRTSDALSKVVTAEHVLASLVMFIVLYALLGALFVYLLNKRIQEGPEDATWPENPTLDDPTGSVKEPLLSEAKR